MHALDVAISEDKHEEKDSLVQRKPFNRSGSDTVASGEQLTGFRRTDADIDKLPQKLRSFYKNQNEIIGGLLEMEAMDKLSEVQRDEKSEANSKSTRVRLAVNASFGVNVCLFAFKVVAAAMSGSLAVVASALDSLLDLLSGAILFLISRAISKRDPYKYPVSKSRLEPVGIIVFAAVMGMTSLQIIQNAITRLINGFENQPPKIHLNWFALGVLLATIGVKLALYFYCSMSKNISPLVAALARDHKNDVMTNSVGTASACIAAFLSHFWWFDSVGALLLSSYIIVSWIRAGKEQIGVLVGLSASPQLLGQLAFLAAHHDRRILRVDKVLAYHFGVRLLVEVDIVLPENMPLRETHDISESLQIKIEKLDMVERAFVHADYEWTHSPEHKVV